MPSAIVAGATGILGRQIVHHLAKNPEKWNQIYALSRSKSENYPSNVSHRRLDLQASAQEMVQELHDVEVEYVFFAAYLERPTAEESLKVNGDLLENFLTALSLAGLSKKIRRVLLVTGAKHYGGHLGIPKNPMEESDPWVTGPGWPPNFYYHQQEILHRHAAQDGFEWNVTYPCHVIGLAKGNFMNLSTALALYSAVTRELGQDLVFPGSEQFYMGFDSFTSSKLHAQFCEWVVLESQASNQAFNVVNGDVESWQNMWPKLADRFGLKVPSDQFILPAPDAAIFPLHDRPPLQNFAERSGLKGKITASKIDCRVDLVKWSSKPEVRAAWVRLAERDGLEKDAFEKATWQFVNFILGKDYGVVLSMSKARALGWTGYVDTWKIFEDTFNELEREKIVPSKA